MRTRCAVGLRVVLALVSVWIAGHVLYQAGYRHGSQAGSVAVVPGLLGDREEPDARIDTAQQSPGGAFVPVWTSNSAPWSAPIVFQPSCTQPPFLLPPPALCVDAQHRLCTSDGATVTCAPVPWPGLDEGWRTNLDREPCEQEE